MLLATRGQLNPTPLTSALWGEAQYRILQESSNGILAAAWKSCGKQRKEGPSWRATLGRAGRSALPQSRWAGRFLVIASEAECQCQHKPGGC